MRGKHLLGKYIVPCDSLMSVFFRQPDHWKMQSPSFIYELLYFVIGSYRIAITASHFKHAKLWTLLPASVLMGHRNSSSRWDSSSEIYKIIRNIKLMKLISMLDEFKFFKGNNKKT